MTALFMASSANALLSVSIDELTDAGAAVTASDLDGDGAVTTFLNSDNFSVTVATGLGAPALSFPDLLDLAISGSTKSTVGVANPSVQVMLTETGLPGLHPDFKFASLSSTGGWGAGDSGTMSFELWIGDAAFEQGTLLASNTGPDADFITTATNISPFIGVDGTFSLTLVATLTADGGSQSFSTDTFVVPEPSILALFGAGLIGMGLARRRMKK